MLIRYGVLIFSVRQVSRYVRKGSIHRGVPQKIKWQLLQKRVSFTCKDLLILGIRLETAFICVMLSTWNQIDAPLKLNISAPWIQKESGQQASSVRGSDDFNLSNIAEALFAIQCDSIAPPPKVSTRLSCFQISLCRRWFSKFTVCCITLSLSPASSASLFSCASTAAASLHLLTSDFKIEFSVSNSKILAVKFSSAPANNTCQAWNQLKS